MLERDYLEQIRWDEAAAETQRLGLDPEDLALTLLGPAPQAETQSFPSSEDRLDWRIPRLFAATALLAILASLMWGIQAYFLALLAHTPKG